MSIRLSPYGMSECATCDSPDVTHAYDAGDAGDRELVPQCSACARRLKAEMPDTLIVAWQT